MSEYQHVAQFYETDEFLLTSLSDFIGTGLRAGEPCIVVATEAHRAGLEERLRALGLDVSQVLMSGQYIVLDASDSLAKFMAGGTPEPERFSETIGSIIRQTTQEQHRVRIFGEMVGLLWTEGNYDAAIRLEALWNKLLETESCVLFCAYPITGWQDEALGQPLGTVCAQHSRVIPAESYTALTNGDDRLRSIIHLQQKARLLEAEIAERKQAEEQLRVSEIRYRRLFEASRDAILIVDAESHQITDANPFTTALLGYTREDLVGKQLWEIGLFTAPEATRQAFRSLYEQESIHYEYLSLQTKDRQPRAVEWVSTLYRANGHQVIQCNIRDITTRKQTEDALQALKDALEVQVEDLRQLHEMSVTLTSTLDFKAVLHEVLRAALAMQGTTLGLLSLCDPEQDGLKLELSSGFPEALLPQIARTPPGGGACGTSYTQRRRVVVEDVDRDPIFAQYRDLARAVGFRACHSTPLITRSGNLVGVLSAHFGQPYRPSERETRLMDLYAQMAADFIENARLHEQVHRELKEREQVLVSEQRTRAEAERANRMKDEFLATVSHELRTPLTSIIGWSQRLRRRRLDEATVARGLEVIERSALAQAQLVEDILDVSRVITGKLRLNIGPVDLTSVINGAIDSVQLAAEAKNIQLLVTLDPAARHVTGDAGRLQQVVWNLLSNAIKFTLVGGRVEVRLQGVRSNVQISVSDTGEGISPDFLPYIFDRFRQADGSSTRSQGGLGLGLAIVRHLVELHGGSVSAESAGLGQGATFMIRLPRGMEQERARARGKASGSVARKETVTGSATSLPSLAGVQVLVVDDDRDTLQLLADTLAECGAEVQAVVSAPEALDVLQWYQADVLVSDLAMPGEDGCSLIRKVRAWEEKSRRQIRAVALTAYARAEDRALVLAAGFNVFVPKPVEPDELIITIADLVRS